MPAASAPIAFSPVVVNEIARYRSTRVIPYACRVEKLPIRQVHAVRTHRAREHGHAALELALISERMVPRRYPQVREQQHDLGGLAQELGTHRAVRHPLAYHRLITGTVCGVDVAAMEDPVEQNARHLDELVDELTRERAMEKVPCA